MWLIDIIELIAHHLWNRKGIHEEKEFATRPEYPSDFIDDVSPVETVINDVYTENRIKLILLKRERFTNSGDLFCRSRINIFRQFRSRWIDADGCASL